MTKLEYIKPASRFTGEGIFSTAARNLSRKLCCCCCNGKKVLKTNTIVKIDLYIKIIETDSNSKPELTKLFTIFKDILKECNNDLDKMNFENISGDTQRVNGFCFKLVNWANANGIVEPELTDRNQVIGKLLEGFLKGSKNLDLSSHESITSLPNIDELAPFIEKIDIRGCTALTGFDANQQAFAKLTSFNATNCTALKALPTGVPPTALTELEVSGCTALSTLPTEKFEALTKLDISGCPALTALDCAKFPALTNLNINGSGITELDLSEIKPLPTTLNLGPAITKLTVGARDAAEAVALDNTYGLSDSLVHLDVSGCLGLSTLAEVDLTQVKTLNITGSGIKTLDLSTSKRSELPEELDYASLNELYVGDKVTTMPVDIQTCKRIDLTKAWASLTATAKEMIKRFQWEGAQTGHVVILPVDAFTGDDTDRVHTTKMTFRGCMLSMAAKKES